MSSNARQLDIIKQKMSIEIVKLYSISIDDN